MHKMPDKYALNNGHRCILTHLTHQYKSFPIYSGRHFSLEYRGFLPSPKNLQYLQLRKEKRNFKSFLKYQLPEKFIVFQKLGSGYALVFVFFV